MNEKDNGRVVQKKLLATETLVEVSATSCTKYSLKAAANILYIYLFSYLFVFHVCTISCSIILKNFCTFSSAKRPPTYSKSFSGILLHFSGRYC